MSFTSWQVYIESNVKKVDDVIGVYELSNSKTDMSAITYIGRGKLRTELLRYLKEPCTGPSTYFRYEVLNSDERAQQRERALLKEFEDKYKRLPKCNQRIG